MSKPSFSSPPPTVSRSLITFPTPDILLVTLNRPADLNCIDTVSSHDLDALWKWYDNEPTLRCAVITGSGRAFCTGADLKGMSARSPPSSLAFSPSNFLSKIRNNREFLVFFIFYSNKATHLPRYRKKLTFHPW